MVDVPTDEGASQPTLQWTACTSGAPEASEPAVPILPPGACFPEVGGLRVWQQPLPESIFAVPESAEELGTSDEEMSEEGVSVALFLDFIFTPGRFAKQAIYNAFKVIINIFIKPLEFNL